MGEDEEQQYMRVPKEHAELMMGKLADAGLIDEDAEVRILLQHLMGPERISLRLKVLSTFPLPKLWKRN